VVVVDVGICDAGIDDAGICDVGIGEGEVVGACGADAVGELAGELAERGCVARCWP
jgi:hypothetical protein